MRCDAYAAGDAALLQNHGAPVALRYVRESADDAAKRGEAITVRAGDRVVCCGGVALIWPGFGVLWGLFDYDIDDAAKRLVARACLDLVARQSHVRRIEATARCDFSRAIRFLHFLGLDIAARLDGYDPDGADHWLFARVLK